LPALLEIATGEKVVLPEKARILRADYIDAIFKSRHPDVSAHAIAENDAGLPMIVDDRQDHEKEEAKEKDAADKETTVKKLLAGNNNVKELIAIVAKEKIAMGTGRKNKEHYINAIYLARKSNN
jgi:hypothetical protein